MFCFVKRPPSFTMNIFMYLIVCRLFPLSLSLEFVLIYVRGREMETVFPSAREPGAQSGAPTQLGGSALLLQPLLLNASLPSPFLPAE